MSKSDFDEFYEKEFEEVFGKKYKDKNSSSLIFKIGVLGGICVIAFLVFASVIYQFYYLNVTFLNILSTIVVVILSIICSLLTISWGIGIVLSFMIGFDFPTVDTFKSKRKLLWLRIFFIIATPLFFFLGPLPLNFFFREKETYIEFAKIRKQSISKSYYSIIELKSGAEIEIPSEHIYKIYKKGDSICVTLQEGLFGWPILIGYNTTFEDYHYIITNK